MMTTSATNSTTATNSKATVNSAVPEAPLTEKATSAAHQAVDTLSSKAAAAEQNIRQGASTSSETLSEKQKLAQDKLTEYSGKTRKLASENPLATAGIAFAAGMLVTALIRRK